MHLRSSSITNPLGTQIGLFVYYYEQSSESDLPRRSASIVDTNPLESQLSQNCPLTVADTFAVHEFGTFQRFAPNLLNDAKRERELATQHAPTSEDLNKSGVFARYLELHLSSIIETLGTNNSFIATTLKVAERYSKPTGSKTRVSYPHRSMCGYAEADSNSPCVQRQCYGMLCTSLPQDSYAGPTGYRLIQ